MRIAAVVDGLESLVGSVGHESLDGAFVATPKMRIVLTAGYLRPGAGVAAVQVLGGLPLPVVLGKGRLPEVAFLKLHVRPGWDQNLPAGNDAGAVAELVPWPEKDVLLTCQATPGAEMLSLASLWAPEVVNVHAFIDMASSPPIPSQGSLAR